MQFNSLILIGGKGTRLEESRKIINPNIHAVLKDFYGQEGPKALAALTIDGQTAPLLDWHLDIHVKNSACQKLFLGLGFQGQMIAQYCAQKFNNFYQQRPITLLYEENPAGTLAPLLKMAEEGLLTDEILVLANGDNLLQIDLEAAINTGLATLKANKIDIDKAVINIVVGVPRRVSASYGVLDIDHKTNLARKFMEKQAAELNPYEEIDGQEISWINTGFSIIINPRVFFATYISQEVIETSRKLEKGLLNYQENEKLVKYETLYGQVAEAGALVVVKTTGYWADSGTEATMLAIEAKYRP